MKRLAISTIIVLSTLGGLILLWQFRAAVVLFVLSLVLSAAARPVIEYLVRRGLPGSLAILLTYLFGLGFFLGLLFLVGRPLLVELQVATNNFANFYEQITRTWPQGTPFQRALASRLPEPQQLFLAITGERGALLIQATLGIAQSVFGLVGQFLFMLVLSIYWSLDRVHFERFWLSILPARRRTQAREIWRDIEAGIGAYVRSELVQSLLAGLLLGAGYWLMGFDYPVLLAVSGALLWLMPWLGALLAVVLPVIAGLSSSPLLAIMAAVYTLVVLLVLEVVVEPRLFNRRRFSSLLILLFVVIMADAFGLPGLIIAPPFAAAIQIFFRSLIRYSSPPQIVNAEAQLENLKTRLSKTMHMLETQQEPPPPEAANLVERIENLVEAAQEYLQEEQAEEPPALGLPVAVDKSR